MARSQQIIFVYNANGGVMNSVSDLFRNVAKQGSNPCKLCSLTYSGAFMKKIWKAYIDSLGMTSVFMHKDEFMNKYPSFHTTFPVVLLKTDDSFTTLIDTQGFDPMNDLADLINELNERIPHAKAQRR